MTTSRRLGLGFALVISGGLGAAGCSGSSVSCSTACQHIVACLSDAGVTDLPNCDSQCAPASDAGHGDCPGIGRTHDCINALSCAEVVAGDGQGTAFQACEQESGC